MRHGGQVLAAVLLLAVAASSFALPVDDLARARELQIQRRKAMDAFQSFALISPEQAGVMHCSPVSKYRQVEASSNTLHPVCMREWASFVLTDKERVELLREIVSMPDSDMDKPHISQSMYPASLCLDIDWPQDNGLSAPCSEQMGNNFIQPMRLKRSMHITYLLKSKLPLVIEFDTGSVDFKDAEPLYEVMRDIVDKANRTVRANLEVALQQMAQKAEQHTRSFPRMLKAAYSSIPKGSRPKDTNGEPIEDVPLEVEGDVRLQFSNLTAEVINRATLDTRTALEQEVREVNALAIMRRPNGTDAKRSVQLAAESYKWEKMILQQLSSIDDVALQASLSTGLQIALHDALDIDHVMFARGHRYGHHGDREDGAASGGNPADAAPSGGLEEVRQMGEAAIEAAITYGRH